MYDLTIEVPQSDHMRRKFLRRAPFSLTEHLFTGAWMILDRHGDIHSYAETELIGSAKVEALNTLAARMIMEE